MKGKISTPVFFNQVKNVMDGGGLLTYMYHSIDDASGSIGDNWFALVVKDSLQKQLDTLASVKDQVWVTTFAKAIKYNREKNCAKLTELTPPKNSKWVLNLSDTLRNNKLYNQALSIRVKKMALTIKM